MKSMFLALLLVSVFLLPRSVQAWPMYLESLDSEYDFIHKYPSWPYKVGPKGCMTCHANYPPKAQFNPYGQAFKNAKGTAAASTSGITATLAAIAGQDSDGDGYANELEIYFGSFPGDPASTPAPPSGVSASNNTFTDKVRIVWTTYPNATIEVSRADSPDGAKKKLGSAPGSPYDDATAVAGQNYYYLLKACKDSKCTGFSSAASGSRKIDSSGQGISGIQQAGANTAALSVILPTMNGLDPSCKTDALKACKASAGNDANFTQLCQKAFGAGRK